MPENKTTNDTFQIRQTVEWTNAGGEIILLDTRQSLFFGLNALSTFIWEKMVEGVPQNGIVDEIIERYDVAPETAHSDVAAFIRLLREKNLVSVAE